MSSVERLRGMRASMPVPPFSTNMGSSSANTRQRKRSNIVCLMRSPTEGDAPCAAFCAAVLIAALAAGPEL